MCVEFFFICDVFVVIGYVEFGYMFVLLWFLCVLVEIEYVFGDDDISDVDWGCYDLLYGLCCWDFGQIGIYGFICCENIIVFGV